jgi:hypothetical protein
MRSFLLLFLGLMIGCGGSAEPRADDALADDGAAAAADATASAGSEEQRS